MLKDPSPSLQLTTSNFLKGGDFMEQDNLARQAAIEDAISRMEWEGGRVLDERQDPTHPLRKGRIKPDALEIAEAVDQTGQPQ